MVVLIFTLEIFVMKLYFKFRLILHTTFFKVNQYDLLLGHLKKIDTIVKSIFYFLKMEFLEVLLKKRNLCIDISECKVRIHCMKICRYNM